MILNSESFWSNVATYKKTAKKSFMLWNLLHNIFILDDFAHIKRDYDPVFEDTRRRGLQPLTSAKYWKKPGALRGFGIHAYEETKEKIEITYSIVFGTEVEMASSIFLSIQSAFFFLFLTCI